MHRPAQLCEHRLPHKYLVWGLFVRSRLPGKCARSLFTIWAFEGQWRANSIFHLFMINLEEDDEGKIIKPPLSFFFFFSKQFRQESLSHTEKPPRVPHECRSPPIAAQVTWLHLHRRCSASLVMIRLAKCRELNFKLGRRASDCNGEVPAFQKCWSATMTLNTCFNVA